MPELNPIELAWAHVKGYVAKHNKTFTLNEVENLVKQGISTVTPAMWQKFCEHCERVEDAYWKRDGLVEDAVGEILIQAGDDSDESSSDDTEESANDSESDDEDFQTEQSPISEGKKPHCSRQLQLEHTHMPPTFLQSVLPL